jgi:hypothetical protein
VRLHYGYSRWEKVVTHSVSLRIDSDIERGYPIR